jgi:penicillin-binding protein activator
MSRILIVSLAAGALVLAGCQSRTHVERVEPGTTQGLATVDRLDFKDYQMTAEGLINKLLASGRLDGHAAESPAVMMVSTIRNSTMQHIDTQLLTQRITIALDKSEKVVTTTAHTARGAIDPGTVESRNLPNADIYDPSTLQRRGTAIAANLSLAGEITQLTRKEGRRSESYFMIYMTVTDLRTGLAVWQDAEEIVKQGTRTRFGL